MNITSLREKCQIDDGWNPYKFISIYITYLFIKAGISPGQVFSIAVVSVLAGGVLLLTQSESFLWILAGLVFVFSGILDKVDGELARFHQISSPRGAYLDGLVDMLRLGLIVIGVSLAGYKFDGLIAPSLGMVLLFTLFIYNFSGKASILIFNNHQRIADFGSYDDPGTRDVKGIKKIGLFLISAFVRDVSLLICLVAEVVIISRLTISFLSVWLLAYTGLFIVGSGVQVLESLERLDGLSPK